MILLKNLTEATGPAVLQAVCKYCEIRYKGEEFTYEILMFQRQWDFCHWLGYPDFILYKKATFHLSLLSRRLGIPQGTNETLSCCGNPLSQKTI